MSGSIEDWRSAAFRQKVTRTLDEALKKSERSIAKDAQHIEKRIFAKAVNKDSYMTVVARIVLALSPGQNKGQPTSKYLCGYPNMQPSPLLRQEGAHQGDGYRSTRLNPPSASYRDGVSNQDIYPMYNMPRGQAFIINNKIFQTASGMQKYPRIGTDADADALLSLFDKLGFETDVYHNQTSKATFALVERYAYMDHSGYDCFMCAVLTHGEKGLIYSTDGKIQLEEFTSKFRTKRLLGKPKLFFFQACQGSDYMEGADLPDGAAEPDFDEVDGPGQARITLPIEADFLYAHSTVPGYYSWRNSKRGSWFVEAIASVFTKYAFTMDVLRMLTRVNAEVSERMSKNGKKQISSITSQLRKELYFFPKNVVGQQ